MDKKKVLVVDFPTRTRKILVGKLIERGYDVATADSILKAQLIVNQGYDLAIVEGSVNPIGPVDDGADWAISVCHKVRVIVFSLTRYNFPNHSILYFDKIWGYGPLLDYIDSVYQK